MYKCADGMCGAEDCSRCNPDRKQCENGCNEAACEDGLCIPCLDERDEIERQEKLARELGMEVADDE